MVDRGLPATDTESRRTWRTVLFSPARGLASAEAEHAPSRFVAVPGLGRRASPNQEAATSAGGFLVVPVTARQSKVATESKVKEVSKGPWCVILHLRSHPVELRDVRRRIERFATDQGFGDEAAGQITLAVDEALANVIRHAYGGAADERIEICIDTVPLDDTEAMRIVIRDFGQQVDPDKIAGRPLDEVRPGGLGVHIIRTVMDRVEYEAAAEGGMKLTMIKKMPKGECGTP